MKISHKAMILLSGAIWMTVGLFLLPLGLKLMVNSGYNPELNPMISYFSLFAKSQQVALTFIALSLYVGYMKGKFVLSKTVNRTLVHIQKLANPASITQLYSPIYYILLASMIFLGMAIKWLGTPDDIRGFIDIAVGSALINGSMIYFKKAFTLQQA